LVRTGQSLPIFYFSIGSSANHTRNATDFTSSGHLAEALSWQYADKHKVKTYHEHLNSLSEVLQKEQNKELHAYLYKAQHTFYPDSILYLTNSITQQLPKGNAQTIARQTHQAALEMVQSESSFRYLLP